MYSKILTGLTWSITVVKRRFVRATCTSLTSFNKSSNDHIQKFDYNKSLGSLKATTEFYDSLARTYDQTLREQGWQIPELCIAALCKVILNTCLPPATKRPLLRVLDLGSGTGLVGVSLEKNLGNLFQLEMTAFDLSEGMLEQAKERKVYTHFQSGNIMDPKLPQAVTTAPFDVVTCVGVTSYLNSDPTMFRMLDLLVSGGLLAITYKTSVAPKWITLNNQLLAQGAIEIMEHATGIQYLPHCDSSEKECDIVVARKI